MFYQGQSNHICGCYFQGARDQHYSSQRYYLPPVEIESHTKITPVYFSTQSKQKFHNPQDKTIEELRYTFPLYDGVSVGAYTIRYGEKTLKGIVKQKDVAKQTYQAAVARGETAGLLESLPAGVFGVTIGNLPARTDVFVEITYLGELKHDAGIDGLRYTLPTAIAPRYGDYPGELLKNDVSGKGISIKVDIDMAKSAIRKVQSPTHPIAVTTGNVSTDSSATTFSPSLGSASLTQGSTELGSDFVLQLLINDISNPQAILERHPDLDTRAIMATLVPKFNLKLSTPEICFIADQSGSMSGSKNAALVAALQLFLKSLPFGVRFNICAFGNSYSYLWPKAQAYTEENLKKASDFVNTFRAQYGGTEIYEPVKQAFLRRHGDLPLEIMLLTDGEIWQEQHLFELINTKIHTDGVDARVFTLGIGSDVSHTLCEGVARAGNGFAQFVVENEETDAKILRMLRASLFPHTKDYTLEINFDDRGESIDDFEIVEKVNNQLHIEDTTGEGVSSKVKSSIVSFFDSSAEQDPPIQTGDRYGHLPKVTIPSILQAPSRIPPLFPYHRTNLYFILGPEAPQKDVVSVTLRAQAPSGPLELTIPVHTTISPDVTVHQLAARKAIQELEEGRGWIQEGMTVDGWEVKKRYQSRLDELAEQEAVRLGEAYQVAGKWCSFVAVGVDNAAAVPSSFPAAEEHLTSAPAPSSGLFGSKSFNVDALQAPTAGFGSFKRMLGVQPNSAKPAASGLATPASSLFGGGGGLFGSSSSARPAAPAMTTLASSSYGSGGGLFGNNNSAVSPGYVTSGSLFGAAAPVPPPPASARAALPASQDAIASMPLDCSYEDLGDDAIDGDMDEDVACLEEVAPLSVRQTGSHAKRKRGAVTEQVDMGNPTAVLRAVIALQKFSGCWQWDAALLELIGSSGSGLKQNDVSATKLVLTFFDKRMSAHRDVWSMVAEKAQAWLYMQITEWEISDLTRIALESFC